MLAGYCSLLTVYFGGMTTPFAALAAIPNACQALPTVVTGGQPSAADFERFAKAKNLSGDEREKILEEFLRWRETAQ